MDWSGNNRDRSPEAEQRRIDRSVTLDFTGWSGLMRSLVNHKPAVHAEKKPKRGWAAARRRSPFREYFADAPARLEKARMRHVWYRRQKANEALRAAMNAEAA